MTLDHLQFRQWSAKQLAALGPFDRFGERTARETKRRSPHRGAEDVERRHRDLEAIAGRADEIVGADTAVFESQACKRVRRHHLDALCNRQPGIIAAHGESRQAPRTGRLAGTRKYDIEVGDTAVRYPRLLAVENETVAVSARRH